MNPIKDLGKIMNPKISIVTPSYNQGQFIEETILSILDQNYPNLEYIIIDGGSTDKSVDIIKKYEDRLTFWVSEKDQGQTHAINKGFRIATGEVLNWINSDDLLESDALQTLSSEVTKNPSADVYFGDYRAINGQSQTVYSRKSAPYSHKALFFGRQLSSQPAVFFRRKLLENMGYLDEKKQFCMDTEFWIRIANKGARFHQIKSPLAVTRVHAEAKTTKLQQVLHNEHKEIIRNYNTLKMFKNDSRAEDIYFTLINRVWRLIAAVRRMIFRKDFTYLKATKALGPLNLE